MRRLTCFPSDYTVIDLETTGLCTDYCEIIEATAIRYRDHKECETFTSFVKPESHIPPFITSLTGISDDMVADSPSVSVVMDRLLNFIGDDIVVGHNVNFDLRFIKHFAPYPVNNDYVDTLFLSRRLLKGLPNHRLCTLTQYFKVHASTHRAEDDCISCHEILECMRIMSES